MMKNIAALSILIAIVNGEELSCAGAVIGGEPLVAGVCYVTELTESVSVVYKCKGGSIYSYSYLDSGDCTGSSSAKDYCALSADCSSYCDYSGCDYVRIATYSGVTQCNTEGTAPNGDSYDTLIDAPYPVNFCQQESDASYEYAINADGNPLKYEYSTTDCSGESTTKVLTSTCSTAYADATVYTIGSATDIDAENMSSIITGVVITIVAALNL